MRLSLKTKFTLAISLLVLAVVAVVSGLYLGQLTKQVLRQSEDRASFVAQQVFLASQNALSEAAERGETPASSSAADLRGYVHHALDNSSTLNSLIESAVGYTKTIYEITITDRDGIVLISSDSGLRGQKIAQRPGVHSFVHDQGFFQELRTLYGPPQVYEFSLPFNLGQSKFGDVRIGLSSALIRNEISPSLELDRISAGEFDFEPMERTDELGKVSEKIVGIGKQLRDVREIFSTLRENLDQVMGGLEDGLLLFNAEGRAVLVSPSVEKFLGGRAAELRGRRVSEIFPPGHAIRSVLRIKEDEIEPVEGAELTYEAGPGPSRIGLSAQVIREHGARMGTLVTLRDVESLERIGNQLQVSERLAALGRVTAGVAHEVKNPLNSMRLWLEVLKANMPTDPEPQQAVKMLDSEIDRLDRAVKTFLNFTKPVEMKLEETDIRPLLQDVIDAAKPSISRAGVDLRVDLPSEFPSLMIDQQLIHQAVLNLLLNASEFTPRGGRVTLALRRSGETAIISVADSGKGISLEDQKKIFQLFFTTRPGGSGIGLANTFRFVQLHNGQIEFESEVGRGTTFRVELPLAHSIDMLPGKVRDFSTPFAEDKKINAQP